MRKILAAMAAIALILAVAALAGCSYPPCSGHGGVKWTNGKIYECNDGTWE